ncbi:MAG: hypothetical protein JSU75_07990 [Gammaproteobacteria bacterium]|nr:MAG: hypothetical protein JSU75_07990 [Gammaproteobacteria bacterium]
MRTILILIAVVIVILAARRLYATTRRGNSRQIKSGQMVQCARCGIYIPESEALGFRGRHYCSAAHRDADND